MELLLCCMQTAGDQDPCCCIQYLYFLMEQKIMNVFYLCPLGLKSLSCISCQMQSHWLKGQLLVYATYGGTQCGCCIFLHDKSRQTISDKIIPASIDPRYTAGHRSQPVLSAWDTAINHFSIITTSWQNWVVYWQHLSGLLRYMKDFIGLFMVTIP